MARRKPRHRRRQVFASPEPGREDRPVSSADEPVAEGEDWVSCGGQRIFAVDQTGWGFPIGVTEAEFRHFELCEGRQAGAGWARARDILAEIFASRGRVEVGYVKKMGDGLSREVFVAEVECAVEAAKAYAVLLPRARSREPDLDGRTLLQARMLAALGGRTLTFRVPHVVAVVRERWGLALVETFLRGVPLDLRAGRQPGVRPWQVVGQLAAAVHACEIPPEVCGGYPSRRAHALAACAVFETLPEKESLGRDAHAWAHEHLPPETPASLLHGDLLGQNILLAPGDLSGLLDWEYAHLGDPAYDLAIVTRGVKQPFQIAGGLQRLLDAYQEHGGVAIQPHDVQLHELCLVASSYGDALYRPSSGGHPPEVEYARLAGLLRRLR